MYCCGMGVAKRKHSAMIINEKSETFKQKYIFKNVR